MNAPPLRLALRARPARRMRAALQRVPPMLGGSARELATMPTLAMLAGDWPTAVAAARRRLVRRPGDEGALVALAVALWELGHEDEARAVVAGASTQAELRAAARVHNHLDDPEGAQSAVDRLEDPAASAALVLGVGHAWRRHGELYRAIAIADLVLGRLPGSAAANALRGGALAEQRVLGDSWHRRAERRTFDPQRGRILHMVQRSLPGHRSGSTYRTHYTVQAQLRAGLDPHVLTQPAGLKATEEDVDGIPHHRCARRVRASASLEERLGDYLDAAAPIVEAVRPAVLHAASDYVNALVALELGRRHGLPVVYEVRGFPEVLQGRWSGSRATFEKAQWRREIEAQCWRRADAVVTLAEVMKRRIAAEDVAEERITVVPNAVDAGAFRPLEPDPELRRRLGLGRGFVVGYVSTLSSYEGLSVLVEAVARLAGRGRDVRALIVGDGKERVFLGQLARRLGIGDRVVLTGRVEHQQVASHLALMDVFVVPRTAEITSQLVTPLKPYEAMAAGRAVLVARTAALSEMVIEGQTGRTFIPEDPSDLARVIEELRADPAERAALGVRSQEWVRRHRSWDANAAAYRELYHRLGAV